MKQAVVADIGGTNARFALVVQNPDGLVELFHQKILSVVEYPSLKSAFSAWRQGLDMVLPDTACLAIAGPVDSEILRFANIPWIIEKRVMTSEIGVRNIKFINDFHSISKLISEGVGAGLLHLFGPEGSGGSDAIVSVIGPGTGLGVALLNGKDGSVIPTEGGHIGFAPSDDFEDGLVRAVREKHGRVSAERVVAGPGLAYFATAIDEKYNINNTNKLWEDISSNCENKFAFQAFSRWAAALGTVCGDMALAHGSTGVVLAGGVIARIRHRLPETPFYDRFCQKGRFRHRMEAMSVSAVSHPEPGLLGAAVVAFAEG